ncbi:MAG: response regulator transcription factor [Pseudomonadota bacterium]
MQTDTKIAVAILEDDPGTRAAFLAQIEALGFILAAMATSLSEAPKLLTSGADVCLVDLHLTDGSGIDFIREARQSWDAKFLVVTTFGDEESVVAAIQAGADGYIVKDAATDALGQAIVDVCNGASPLSPAIARYLVRLFRDGKTERQAEKNAIAHLTKREIDVLEGLAQGLRYKEVAIRLGISHHTVAEYIKIIYRKLQVTTRVGAIREAVKQGFVEL